MNIYEYQAKELLKSFGLPVPNGFVLKSITDLEEAFQKTAGIRVLKAQVHAGGRGKAGGVKLVKTLEEGKDLFQKLFQKSLVTLQTGPEGEVVDSLYLEEGAEISKELYLSLLIDRKDQNISVLVSSEGGMDIEEVAHNTPEKILKLNVNSLIGLQAFQAREMAFALGLKGEQVNKAVSFFLKLYEAFLKTDADLLEINPLVLTPSNELLILDAKMSLDENALYRHKDFVKFGRPTDKDPIEKEAAANDLSYVRLEGDIGCLVNGAGLAMATMDLIHLHGGSPANFLDVGGSATKERVSVAFKLLLSDKNVKAVLVNIFGGIMRCDVIAEGILAALAEVNLQIPLIVRLAGTNVEKGQAILNGTKVILANTLEEAANLAVKAAKEAA